MNLIFWYKVWNRSVLKLRIWKSNMIILGKAIAATILRHVHSSLISRKRKSLTNQNVRDSEAMRHHRGDAVTSGIIIVFTARCTLVQSAVLRSHVVCLSVTLVNCDHISWNSSKIISSLVSLGCSLFATPTWRVCFKGNTPKFWPKVTHFLLIWASETFDRKLRPNGYR